METFRVSLILALAIRWVRFPSQGCPPSCPLKTLRNMHELIGTASSK